MLPSHQEPFNPVILNTTPLAKTSAGTWSDKGTTSFDASLKDFVNNTGDASLGMYFDGHGWPMFFNPNKDEISIPWGQMCSTSALWMCTGMSFIRPISTRTAGSSRVAAVRDRPAVKERSKRWRADSR